MSKFNAGQSFADGDTVTGAKLNNIAGLLDIYTGLISEQTAMAATVSTADQLLIADTDNGDSGAANRVTVQKLLNDTLTNGTFTGLNLTGNLNVVQLSTLGTISSTRGTIGILNSTTGTIASLNTTTGTIPTLTAGTTTSTAANITNGTIATLNSTTPTFLGAITASTNTINVGSGQIYKDATGNVGLGTASPADQLHINKSAAATIRLQSSSNTCFVEGNNSYLDLHGGSQAIRMVAGSTERLRIDSSGNVSIGTATALSKLHVHGDLTMSNATTAVTASTSTITPPATVAGYLTVSINGTSRKIAFYAT